MRRMCAVLGVSPSSYYAWRRRPASGRQQANLGLVEHIRRAHIESRGTYTAARGCIIGSGSVTWPADGTGWLG